MEAEPEDPDSSALRQVHIVDGGHFSLDTAANEIAAPVGESMDMPKESIPGEEIMRTATTPGRPPLPPFTRESAIQKVRLAEDGWNTRDPAKVALAYAIDSRWRNRSEFIDGRSEIIAFLSRKWAKELDYRLIKEMWAFTGNRIAVRFAYEWHDDSDHWYRSYGNENWEFSDDGLMASRFASINDIPILGSERKYHWVLGRRPDDHPGLSDLSLWFNYPFISMRFSNSQISAMGTIRFSEAEFG